MLPLAPHNSNDNNDNNSTLSAPSSASSSSSSLVPAADDDASSSNASDDDYAEDTAKLVRLRRRVAALRGCRMIAVWPADDDDRVSGR